MIRKILINLTALIFIAMPAITQTGKQELQNSIFVQLLNKKNSAAEVKKAAKERKLILDPVLGSFTGNNGNTGEVFSTDYKGEITRIYTYYNHEDYQRSGLKEPVQPTLVIPLGLQWGIQEYDVLSKMGTPVFVERAGRNNISYVFHYNITEAGEKSIRAEFDFLVAKDKSGQTVNLLQAITVSVGKSFSNTALGSNQYNGTEYAKGIVKPKQPIVDVKKAGIIADNTLAMLVSNAAKDGWQLTKTLYPDFTITHPNTSLNALFNGFPVNKMMIAVYTKDSIANVKSHFSATLAQNGKVIFNRKQEVSKQKYLKQYGVYASSALYEFPNNTSAPKYEFRVTYYDNDNIDKPVYVQVFTK